MDHRVLRLGSEIPPAGWLEVFLWLVGRRKRFRVVNESMLPLLSPGQEVLAARRTNPEPGEVWVLAHPQKPDLKIIKTVVGKGVDGQYEVRGLNQTCSEDSRQFGPARSDLFLGRVESLFFSPEPGPR